MLKLFDPTLDIDEEEYSLKQSQKHQLIPLYQKPKIVYCLLPGELHYLDVRKPKLPISIETARRNENYVRLFLSFRVFTSSLIYTLSEMRVCFLVLDRRIAKRTLQVMLSILHHL